MVTKYICFTVRDCDQLTCAQNANTCVQAAAAGYSKQQQYGASFLGVGQWTAVL